MVGKEANITAEDRAFCTAFRPKPKGGLQAYKFMRLKPFLDFSEGKLGVIKM